jgi:hypothetical protein
MMELTSGVLVRRAVDRSSRSRRPLRLEIRRRAARRGPAGVREFVTEVLFGESGAVLVPRAAEPLVADGLAVVEPAG